MQLYARIEGHGPTAYIAGFNAKKLQLKQAWAKENGYGFNLLNHVVAPAAEGIQKPLSKQDADRATMPAKQAKSKLIKVKPDRKVAKAEAQPKAATRPVKRHKVVKAKPVKPVRTKTVKPVSQYGWGKNPKSHTAKEKATINLTTGEYFDSVQDAAKAIGGLRSGVCRQIRGLRTIYYGCRFRYATKKEVKAKRMIDS